MSKKKNGQSQSALEKALSVLEAIVDQPQSVGLPDLAERLGMSRQSMHRLVKQLNELGLVYKLPKRDRFAIGDRFSRLALAALTSSNRGIPLVAIMQDVVRDVGESCALGVMIGQEYVYLETAEADHFPRVTVETGGKIPPYCTSGGKVMMAFLSDQVQARILQSMTIERFTAHTIASIEDFKEELREIRSRGYAIGNQEFAHGMIGVGVPVLDKDGNSIAELAIHAPTARLSLDDAPEIAEKLKVRARQISEYWREDT